jgi:hypothetical protein
MLVISAFGRLKQEDCEFKATLYYKVRPYLKKRKNVKVSNKHRKMLSVRSY